MQANAKMVALNSTNYHLWKGKMKDLLFFKKLHLPIFTTQKPDSMSEEEWDFEHQQVCGFIRQYVEDNVYNHIANRHMPELCGRRLSLCMLLSRAIINCIC